MQRPHQRERLSVHEHKSTALWSVAPVLAPATDANSSFSQSLTRFPATTDALANPNPTGIAGLPLTTSVISTSPPTSHAVQKPAQSSSSTLSQSLTQSGSQRGAKPPLRSSSNCNGFLLPGPATLNGNGNGNGCGCGSVNASGTGSGSLSSNSSSSSCKLGSLRLTKAKVCPIPASACTLRSRTAATIPSFSSSPTSATSTSFLTRKSASSPLLADLQSHLPPPPYSESQNSLPPARSHPHTHPSSKNASPVIPSPPTNLSTSIYMHSDTEDDEEMIYTSRLRPHTHSGTNSHSHGGSSTSLRSRIFGLASAGGGGGHSRGRSDRDREQGKLICTTPGETCAGETETETDEPSRHLPTARIIPSSGPLIPPHTLQQTLTPLLFEFARFLSVVPAILGTLYNLYHIYAPPPPLSPNITGRPPPDRLDFFVAALWAILTGYQCLALATGLLTRWRLYYEPLSTLVRLLALQGICWQATHLSMSILNGERRPVVTWAVVGTTTCISRSVQIWVTSNLWWEVEGVQSSEETPAATNLSSGLSASVAALAGLASSSSSIHSHSHPSSGKTKVRGGYWKRVAGGTWGGRRWDWREVGIHCMLPAGVLYFVMAWAEQVRREWVAQVPAPSC
ncbi:unnamed protein product [Cyclocybe aegerita]|uniref:N-glycosylation protein EOS1 n=1 Tax=Cyclocybe aegerita TaxID=1973307 RepID=A0A8S0WB72_CYCAE|nr:unnamed protein product [Cyclocybe aegerita]